MDDDEEVAAHSPGAGRRGGGAQRREATSPLITGLKQCLLARLFAEAQQQSQAAAAAAADAATACAAAPAAGSLHRVVGSTGSLPSAAAAAAPPLGLHRTAGSGGSLLGLAAHGGPSAGLGSGGGNLTPYPHWRRPLDRFYYYFEAHMELLMWKVRCGETRAHAARCNRRWRARRATCCAAGGIASLLPGRRRSVPASPSSRACRPSCLTTTGC